MILIALVIASIAPAASALRYDGPTVILPIIGRFPGAGGTQWRTDVFIANHSTVVKNLTITFYVAGGSPLVRAVTVPTFSAVSLPDITGDAVFIVGTSPNN
ncbi:MAG TPA: hypothetical protein VMU84_16395 [Thermoanaerobaculia bacterium]|nr:hypothetical protein [Thermoanaerobaculia bacterium]